MSDIAVKVEGLGKKYVIGRQKSGDFRNSFGDKIKRLLDRNGSSAQQEFWALQDINFEIKKGEAVGIIGRNGAGKSTLLKILSRITEPSKGRFEINGRVSSLLEVGTGFHPELTGRENIYLNGTILGMRRIEIKEKLDEIIAFSGVEKFLDTSVKHYSSGMKVRLAFSVAAHLEPEILIVDEVLAVGDAEFQKKCLGKMDDVSKNEGRTVLFVSHNMGAVNKLCRKGVVLDKGEISFIGNTSKAVDEYVSQSIGKGVGFEESETFEGQEEFAFKELCLMQLGKPVNVVQNNLPLVLKIKYHLQKEMVGFRVFFDVCDVDNILLFRSLLDEGHQSGELQSQGDYVFLAEMPENIFVSGKYNIKVQAGIVGVKKFQPEEGYSLSFLVEETGVFFRNQFTNEFRGKLTQPVKWYKEAFQTF